MVDENEDMDQFDSKHMDDESDEEGDYENFMDEIAKLVANKRRISSAPREVKSNWWYFWVKVPRLSVTPS